MNYKPISTKHILLHILWPELFEDYASADYKKNMAKNLSDHFGLEELDDVDATILQARKHMESHGYKPNFSMYDDDVEPLWNKQIDPEPINGEDGAQSGGAAIQSDIDGKKAHRAYEVSKKLHDSILIQNRSFLWPEERIWTLENVQRAFGVLHTAWKSGELTSIDQVALLLQSDSDISFQIGFDVQIADILRRDQRIETANRYLDRFRTIDGSLQPDPKSLEMVLEVASYRTPGSQMYRSNASLEYYLVVFGGLLSLLRSPESIGDRERIVDTFERAEVLDSKHDFLPFWALMYRFYPGRFIGVPGYNWRRTFRNLFAYLTEGMEFPNEFAQLDYVRQQIRGDIPVELFDFFHPSVSTFAELNSGAGVDEGPEFDDDEKEPPTIHDLAAVTHLDESRLRELEDLLYDKKQLIFEGPPGSGKTFVAEKFARYITGQPLDDPGSDTQDDKSVTGNDQIELVQFHQSYSYEDFVEGIRPQTIDGQLHYNVVPGIFRKFADKAELNPDKKFVLIIDEINRGNVSRILGELMLLLEYRHKSATLPYSQAPLTIPPNLYIIGTMNSADRSLSQIDYALRRRFYFVRFMSVEDGKADVLSRWLEKSKPGSEDNQRAVNMFVQLNTKLSERLGTDDLQVGHSYFMRADIHDPLAQERVWKYAVMPLLREYLYHDRERDKVLEGFELDVIRAELAPPLPEAESSDDLINDGETGDDFS